MKRFTEQRLSVQCQHVTRFKQRQFIFNMSQEQDADSNLKNLANKLYTLLSTLDS